MPDTDIHLFQPRAAYIADFIRSIAIWVGGFTLFNFVANTSLNDAVVITLFYAFCCFVLALVFSFAGAAIAQSIHENISPKGQPEVWDTDEDYKMTVRVILIFGALFCLVGLGLVMGAFPTFFITKDSDKTFVIASGVALALTILTIIGTGIATAAATWEAW